ncbi:hypothetical protein SUGI_0514710 [Cryptomeria japonica]|nr:hypothetical protein SUGI_0514710 [Cryptomeria japonica]
MVNKTKSGVFVLALCLFALVFTAATHAKGEGEGKVENNQYGGGGRGGCQRCCYWSGGYCRRCCALGEQEHPSAHHP